MRFRSGVDVSEDDMSHTEGTHSRQQTAKGGVVIYPRSGLGEMRNSQKPGLLSEKIRPQAVRTAPLTVFGHHRYQADDLKLVSDPVQGETTIFTAAPGDNRPWLHEANFTEAA